MNQADVLEESYVRITEDKMQAWLYLCRPEEKKAYTKEELETFLTQNGVIMGLNHSNLAAMAKKGIYHREIKVASGQLKTDGQDGYYEFFFAPDSLERTPAVREDGSVDYTAMRSLQNVKKGEPVARYHPAVPGTDGYTVTGEMTKAVYARELPPVRGRGSVRDAEDVNLYRAAMDGKIQIEDNRIDIQTVHEIQGDVDLLTGKIEFYGDIVINGNVESGVFIRAGRNIVISGNVEACTLYAGGDIILQRGIQGAEKGKVTAKGNVQAEFIEYCTVAAGRDIQTNSVMNSVLTAGERIIVNGKRGKIVGGYTHATYSIEAQSLGNAAELKTIIHTGFTEKEYERLVQLNQKQAELKESLAGLNEVYRQLSVPGENGLSKLARGKLAECARERADKERELEQLRQERTEINELIARGRNSCITIKGKIARGSIICMENTKMVIEKDNSFMKYTITNGVIHGTVIAI